MDMEKRPKVGLGVMILKDGKVLFGKRKNAHGEGSWCPPGGHLEYKESLEDCARREVMEETGLSVGKIHFSALTNDIFELEDKHYITIHMVAEYLDGEPQLLEPDKCERWEWFSWDALPSPLFTPTQNLLKQKYSPFKSL
jgi:8-oxo-dGTP diphosphatase